MRMPSTVPAQPLHKLFERHREIARRLVAGDQPIEICAALSITPSRMTVIMASPIFKAHLAELSAKADEAAIDIRARISANAALGAQFCAKVLEDATRENGVRKYADKIAMQVAFDQQDRAGFAAVRKVESLSAVLTAEDIKRLKDRRAALTPINS